MKQDSERHELLVKADRKGREWQYRLRMRAKLDKKANRYLLGKRSRSSDDDAHTTKEDSNQQVSSKENSDEECDYSQSDDSSSEPPSLHQSQEDLDSCSDSSEQLDAYDEFFNDLANEADEASDEDMTKKQGNYYFDDDFKLSQEDVLA